MAETTADENACRLSVTEPVRAVRRRPLWPFGYVVLLTCISFAGCGHASENNPHRPDSFVTVNESIPDAVFAIRYASDDNFLGTRVDGYAQPICLLTEPAAAALQRVQQDVEQRGYALKIFDCYRPQQAAAHFVRWVGDVHDRKMKAHYYPNEAKTRLIETRLYRRPVRTQPRQHTGLDVGEKRRRRGTAHGHAVRLLRRLVQHGRPAHYG